MPSNSLPSSAVRQDPAPKPTPSSRTWTPLRITLYFSSFSLVLILFAIFSTDSRPGVALQRATRAHGLAILPESAVERHVQYQAALIRENLPAYLNFVGTDVLPTMSKNIDEILHRLHGLTELRHGLFYHGHIDYFIHTSGGMERLMEMNNLVLQYHTLENPLIYIPYWRVELGNIHDPNIDKWLEGIYEYNKAISTPRAVSGARYTPLTNYEAVAIASRWDDYRKQQELPTPGLDMLTNMVYLIDGGKQPRYQEAFKNIYRFHSIAFSSMGYQQLDNQTHLQDTFSPFQIAFEDIGSCRELLPIFEEASAAKLGYILNFNNVYGVHTGISPEMAKLSMRLHAAISTLPDDNLIKRTNIPNDQQIAFYAVGNYVFAVYGSLDSPSVFH